MPEIQMHRLIKVAHRFPSLRTMGLAVEHFPNYVNRLPGLHSVDVVLMSIIVRGRGWHVMGGQAFPQSRGSIGVTHYGERHNILTTRHGMEIYNVYLDLRDHRLPILPPEVRDILPAILPMHPSLKHKLNRSVYFQVDDAHRFTKTLEKIREELALCRPGFSEVVRSCFTIFLIDCCREAARHGLSSAPTGTGGALTPLWLEKLRAKLDRDFAEDYRLDDFARAAKISVGHLCRAFRLFTGKTISRYINERRIESAMVRLRHSDQKVLSIALDSGFRDLAYFNRQFKRIVKTTPTQYRSGL